MSEKKGIIGGFTATNSGQIEDCYCLTKFNGRNMTVGGFVGRNTGKISTSFSENNNKRDEFWNNSKQQFTEALEDEKTAEKAGFNFKTIWEPNEKKPVIHFNNNYWFFDKALPGEKKVVTIKSAEGLFKFAEMVNKGDKQFINADVRLVADIDLKGASWTPIGISRENAFCGNFDGHGYTISNLIIKSNDFSKKGLFGYLRGKVYNLEVDCLIKGDGVIGGIAGVNEGEIGCCGVTIQCKGKGHDFSIGGLAGENSGRIFKSFAAGSIKFAVISLVPILILLCAGTIATAGVLSVKNYTEESEGYNGIADDPDQKRYEDDDIIQVTEVEDGQSKIAFGLYEYIVIDRLSGQCTVDFQNPSNSDCKLVATIVIDNNQIKDAFKDAIIPEENIDEESQGVIIAKSGAVNSGYAITYMYLNSFARSNIYPGEYTATVVLYAYDKETNNLKSVQTKLPVTLEVN